MTMSAHSPAHGHPHESHPNHPSHVSHKAHAPLSLSCVILTCSDTRTQETDTSGKLLRHLLEEQGHRIAHYRIIKDEPSEILHQLHEETKPGQDSRVIIINGGTGISKRDSTYEAVDGFLEKRLEGFGEIFRYLSYKEIGSPAMLSRATAGIRGPHVIFSIPGSEGAVRLAMERLILPEIGHIIGELNK
jgi:molybdopterin adenylyltransferase